MSTFLRLIGLTVCFSSIIGSCWTQTTVSAQTLSPAGEGRRLWLKYNCYGCHGMRAQGGMGPNVQHEGGEVAGVVLQGDGGGMPSFSQFLTSTDIDNLRAYLQSIGSTSEPTFNDWWVPIPTK